MIDKDVGRRPTDRQRLYVSVSGNATSQNRCVGGMLLLHTAAVLVGGCLFLSISDLRINLRRSTCRNLTSFPYSCVLAKPAEISGRESQASSPDALPPDRAESRTFR